MKKTGSDRERTCPAWIRRMLSESDDSFGVGVRWGLELRGKIRLNVSGCRRILHYSAELIGLLLPDTELWIYGKSLFCVSYCPCSVGIEGEIGGISFDRAVASRLSAESGRV